MNYTSSYKKTWLAKQRVLEMIHGNEKESYVKLPKLLGALQSCVPAMWLLLKQNPWVRDHTGKKKFLYYCKPIVQVYDIHEFTRSILTQYWWHLQHKIKLTISSLCLAIVEWETTCRFFLNNLRRHVTPQINISLILDRHHSIKYLQQLN